MGHPPVGLTWAVSGSYRVERTNSALYRINPALFRHYTAVAPPSIQQTHAQSAVAHEVCACSYGTVRVDVCIWPLNPKPSLVHTGWARLFVLSGLAAMPE